jgi:hypothetical protein
MSTITYREKPDGTTAVYSGGLRVGTIKCGETGYYYLPAKVSDVPRNRGEVAMSVRAVKYSLEH